MRLHRSRAIMNPVPRVRFARPLRGFIIAMAMLLWLLPACRAPRAPEPSSPPPFAITSVPAAERLYVASLAFYSPFDALYAAESERLDRLCPPPRPDDDRCVFRNVVSNRRRVATLYSVPADDSPASAFINAATHIRAGDGTLAIHLDLEPANQRGEYIPWISDVGDWFYGIHIDGNVRRQGAWIQILHPLLRVPAWIRSEPPALYVDVDPIVGHILELEPLEAADPTGVQRIIPSGSYIITNVASDSVEFRAEVESDFACGEEIPVPKLLPALIRANPRDFFNPDGAPRFATKYTKGC